MKPQLAPERALRPGQASTMSLPLLTSTGSQRVDAILRGTIGLLELAFPDRLRAVYLSGSYADGTATTGSDIDGLVVFKGVLGSADGSR